MNYHSIYGKFVLYFRQIMRKHTTLLLLAWGIISTTTAIYFWNATQSEARKNNLLTESISLHKKAIANEAKSYNAINDCFVVNRGLCDADDFKDTLRTLGDEADGIYSKISALEAEIK
jgi:hypothetical protein